MGLVLVKAYKKPLPADEDITQPIDSRGRMGHMGAGAPSSFFDGPIGETAEERGMPGTGEPTEEMSAVDPRQDEPGWDSGLAMGPADLSEEEAADLESRDLGVAQAEAKKRAMKDRFKAQRAKEQGKKSGKFTRVRNPMFPKNWTGGGNWMKVPKGSLSANQQRALENQQSFIDQLRGAGNVAVLGEKTKKVPSTGTRWKLPELEGPLDEEEEGAQPRETFAPFTQREGQGIVDRLKGMLRHDIPDPSKAKLRSDIKQLEAALRNLFSTEEGREKAPFDPQTGEPIRGGPYESYVGVRRGRGHGAPWRDPETGDTATSEVDRASTAADVERKKPKRVRVIQGPLPKEEEEEPEPEGPPWQDTFLGPARRHGSRSLGDLVGADDPHPFPEAVLGHGDHGLGHGTPNHESVMRIQNKGAKESGGEPIHDMSAFDAHNAKRAVMRLKHAKSQAAFGRLPDVLAEMKKREMKEIIAHDKRTPPPPESLTSQRLWQDILGWHDRTRAAREKHEKKAPVKKSYRVGVVLPRRERLIGVVS